MNTTTVVNPIMALLLALAGGWTSSAGAADALAVAKGAKTATTEQLEEERARAYFTDLALLTQEGKQVRFYSDVLKGRVVLISFIYTHCTDACPLIIHKLSQIKDGLGESFGTQVYFVSMSVDPVRDTPEALAKYTKQQKADIPGWIFLTGEKKNVDAILRKLGQYSATPEAHSTMFLAGNVRTRHWAKISPVAPVGAVVLRLQDLASESLAAGQSEASATSSQKRD
jgi:protein SCO1